MILIKFPIIYFKLQSPLSIKERVNALYIETAKKPNDVPFHIRNVCMKHSYWQFSHAMCPVNDN